MASLIPTLELSAGDYSTHDRPLPQGSSAKNPRGWRDYWTESLADSGILGLPLLDVGYSLVALSALTDPGILRTILRRSLETIGVADLGKLEDLDELCSLCGGYVLQHQSYQMVPGCCGDLANLEEWSSAAAHPGEAWEMLWIGHPSIRASPPGRCSTCSFAATRSHRQTTPDHAPTPPAAASLRPPSTCPHPPDA
jgi:hypothetical protein